MSHSSSPFGKVAVLMGGRSAEREISLMSGQSFAGFWGERPRIRPCRKRSERIEA